MIMIISIVVRRKHINWKLKNIINKILLDGIQRSFNSITVDGDTSTNDSVFFTATGKKKNVSINSFKSNEYKEFVKQFVPNIFFPGVFREYYNYFFFHQKVKEVIKTENNFYKRHSFINKAISKYKNCKYLEIGVSGSNDVFNSIPLKMSDKFGVDPEQGGNFRMTSDDFFKKYNNLKFDVIFIDGLHHYFQCQNYYNYNKIEKYYIFQ